MAGGGAFFDRLMTTSRRSFLVTSSAVVSTGLLATSRISAEPQRAKHDMIIRGGTVSDGTGAPLRDQPNQLASRAGTPERPSPKPA